MNNKKKLSRTLRVVVTAGAIMTVSGGSQAAPWDFGFIIDAGAIYTDNLLLTAEGFEVDDVVYTIAPTITASTDGDRLTADIRYRPEAYFYSDASEFDDVFHVADADVTATLIRNAVFLDLMATNFQTINSPERRIPTTNVPITTNRINARIFDVRPYWDQDLGFARILAEVAFTDTDYNEAENVDLDVEAQDSQSRRSRLTLDNRSRQEGIAWGLEHQYRRMEYEIAPPWEYQRAGMDLGYWVNSSTRLFVAGGYETAFDTITEGDLDEDFWEAGFQYRPSQRLNLELAAGERSYGNSYRADFSYELRRGLTRLTYTESPTTIGEMLLNNSPLIDPDSIGDLLNRPTAADRFLQRRGEWRTNLQLAKSDFSLNVYHELREERFSATGEPLPDEEQSGVLMRFAWRLASNSTFGVTADWANRVTGLDDADLTRFALDYEFAFTQRLSVVFVAQRTEETGEGGLVGDDYVEHQYRALLRVSVQ